jgi:drug/metabolite transporter (DMT)-like permease
MNVRALVLGLLASFFFAFTFVLNRSMDLSGGSWLWSASLRYFFMVPLLVPVVWLRGGLRPMWEEMRKQPGTWLWWSFVGFGLFYAPITFAAAYGPAWLVAGSWQITIVAGSLLVPLFAVTVMTANGPQTVRGKIPLRGMEMSLVILLGVLLMLEEQAQAISTRVILLGFLPVLLAAFAYPLGNRKMMQALGGRLDAWQRTLGMTLASLPVWVVLAVIGFVQDGAPASGQVTQSLFVSVSSGVIATVLFFSATDISRGNVQQLAAVEATQAGEVVFAALGEMILLGSAQPSTGSWLGMGLVMIGMILHSYVSNAPARAKTVGADARQAPQQETT